jgi:SAM-dependent methyltransferase
MPSPAWSRPLSELKLRTANELYESGLDAGAVGVAPVDYHAVGDDGTRRRVPFERWLRSAADEEEKLLEWAVGPVLDVGCGVGRHLVALERRGIAATGIETSARAVQIARARGAEVIDGSIFDLPERGDWGTALLLDGNIGIGGDPERLLARIAELLGPAGTVLVELEPPRSETRMLRLRLEGPHDVSDWIPWAWVGTDAIGPLALAVGLRLDDLWSTQHRWFARLVRES